MSYHEVVVGQVAVQTRGVRIRILRIVDWRKVGGYAYVSVHDEGDRQLPEPYESVHKALKANLVTVVSLSDSQ